MKILAAALCLTLSASTALAQAQASATQMPCAFAAGLVHVHGAVVLGTGGLTYDRFVSGWNYCEVAEYTEAAFVPAADTPQCFVGYRCRPRFKNR